MYLGTTEDLGLKLYPTEPPFLLTTYIDASWNSTKPHRMSWSTHIGCCSIYFDLKMGPNLRRDIVSYDLYKPFN